MRSYAADDAAEISKRLRELRLENEQTSALAKLTHLESCSFLKWPKAGCSCGAAEKNLWMGV